MSSQFVIATSVADIHHKPNPTSELVTQALLNTPVIPGEISGLWTHITLPDYSGWVRSSALEEPVIRGYCEGDEGTCGIPLPYSIVITTPHAPLYQDARGSNTQGEVYLSTVLPYIDINHPQRLRVALPGDESGWLARTDAELRGNHALFPEQDISVVIKYAHAFLERPYLWGGTTWQGLDCSGLVQLCYRMGGYKLPRDAEPQCAALSQTIAQADIQAGDLLFFGTDRITHVALAINQYDFIHAEGQLYHRVCINSLNPDSPNYDQRLSRTIWTIKRRT